MVSRTLTVVNPSMRFKSDVCIYEGSRQINAKSVLNVMAAGIRCGTEIKLVCEGPDEEEALETVAHAIENGLGEK